MRVRQKPKGCHTRQEPPPQQHIPEIYFRLPSSRPERETRLCAEANQCSSLELPRKQAEVYQIARAELRLGVGRLLEQAGDDLDVADAEKAAEKRARAEAEERARAAEARLKKLVYGIRQRDREINQSQIARQAIASHNAVLYNEQLKLEYEKHRLLEVVKDQGLRVKSQEKKLQQYKITTEKIMTALGRSLPREIGDVLRNPRMQRLNAQYIVTLTKKIDCLNNNQDFRDLDSTMRTIKAQMRVLVEKGLNSYHHVGRSSTYQEQTGKNAEQAKLTIRRCIMALEGVVVTSQQPQQPQQRRSDLSLELNAVNHQLKECQARLQGQEADIGRYRQIINQQQEIQSRALAEVRRQKEEKAAAQRQAAAQETAAQAAAVLAAQETAHEQALAAQQAAAEAAEALAQVRAAGVLENEKLQVRNNLHRLNEAFSVSKEQLDKMHTALTNPQFYDLSRSCPAQIETQVNELKQCIGIGRESLMWYELDEGIQLKELLQEQKAELEEYSILKEIFPEIGAPCAEGDEEKDIGFYKQQNAKLAEFTQKVRQEHQTEYAGNFNTFLGTISAAATAGEADPHVRALDRYLEASCQGLTSS
jgi:hypothetical protein